MLATAGRFAITLMRRMFLDRPSTYFSRALPLGLPEARGCYVTPLTDASGMLPLFAKLDPSLRGGDASGNLGGVDALQSLSHHSAKAGIQQRMAYHASQMLLTRWPQCRSGPRPRCLSSPACMPAGKQR